MYIHPLNNEVQKNSSSLLSSNSDETSKESIFMSFNDDDGIIQKTDIQFANKKSEEIATPYLTFLDKYCDGKHNWTTALLDMTKRIIEYFNDCFKNNDEQYNYSSTCLSYDDDSMKFGVLFSSNNTVRAIRYKPNKDCKYIETTYYYEDNKIKKYVEENSKNVTIVEYRNDEGLYCKTQMKQDKKESMFYNKKGKLKTKVTQNYDNNSNIPVIRTTEDYQNDKIKYSTSHLITYENTVENSKIINRKAFDDYGNLEKEVVYDKNKVIKYTDNVKYNNQVFDVSKLNGKIDNTVRQGFTGICGIVGIVNSMFLSDNEENKIDLDNCITYDKSKGIGTVTFKGLNKTYSFTKEEIEYHMTRLGYEDPDFPLMVLGYEQYLLEGRKVQVEIQNDARLNEHHKQQINADIEKIYGSKIVDGTSPSNFYNAITGKDMKIKEISDNSIKNAMQALQKGHIVNACTPSANKNNEISASEMNQYYIIPAHNYSILNINDKYVTYLEPNTAEEKTCPIDIFKKRFTKFYISE